MPEEQSATLTQHDAEILAAIRSAGPVSRDIVVTPGGLTGTTVSSGKSIVVILLIVAVVVGGFAGYTMLSGGSPAPKPVAKTAAQGKATARKTKPANATTKSKAATTSNATLKAKTVSAKSVQPKRKQLGDNPPAFAYRVGQIAGGIALLGLVVWLVTRLRRKKPARLTSIATSVEPGVELAQPVACANGHDMRPEHRFCSTCGAEAAA